MERSRDSLACLNSSLENVNNWRTSLENIQNSDPGSPDPADNRPSILITFQNSASYYTSYMGSGGTRGAGTRRKGSDVSLPQSQVHHHHHQVKEHPIVIMNEYPAPGPVSVAVNGYKQTYDRSFKSFSVDHQDRNFKGFSTGPPTPPRPQGPPGPPGPPVPNLPSSRRESISTNTLELPKNRRSSLSPSLASQNKSPSRNRSLVSSTHSPIRTHHRGGQFESSTLPRGRRARPPRHSQSMPTLTDPEETLEVGQMLQPTPSPRPSVCSSAVADSQTERRPLMTERRSSGDAEDDWSPLPQPKPNWLSLNMGTEEGRKDGGTQSVYVAEIWPSLVCILTAVLMTLIVYILVSYFYYVPHPSTKNSIAPSPHYPSHYPTPYPTPYPYPYPYPPPPYDRFPPYQYPHQPPPPQQPHPTGA